MLFVRNHSLVLPVLVFILLAALDFTSIHLPAQMIFPVMWLCLCALWQRQWALASALFFSFLGDVMGWKNELIPQIGFFALAQIQYIVIYSCLMRTRHPRSRPVKFAILAILAMVYGVAMVWIFPRVGDKIIAYGIAIYALLLLGMCYAACRHKSLYLILGAILFVISDFIIGINTFVERIPHAHMCIMIPYYAGQMLLFAGTQKLYRFTSCSCSCSS